MELSSLLYRNSSLFLRNGFESSGRYGIPFVRKQSIDISHLHLIACTDTKANDTVENKKSGVHFFVDDYHFTAIYNNPEKSLNKYSQYAFLLTPDYSTYAEMNLWRQLESVAHSRWCGAFWQEKGLTVIPTITWSTPVSYDFCFDSVEEHSIVAIGMIGCKHHNYRNFMLGYNELLNRIDPEYVICVGKPFDEMKGNIITVPYSAYGKEVN